MRFFFLSLLVIQSGFNSRLQHSQDSIIGRWMSLQKNVEVEVYRTGNDLRRK